MRGFIEEFNAVNSQSKVAADRNLQNIKALTEQVETDSDVVSKANNDNLLSSFWAIMANNQGKASGCGSSTEGKAAPY